MQISGLQKFSILDYPGNISAIVFTQGCNFRCQFCYNPMLVWPIRIAAAKQASGTKEVGKLKNNSSLKCEENEKSHSFVKESDFFQFLESRVNKLDGIVITGGEPTLQADLTEFISKIKKFGFKIKLDTNGTNPKILKKLIDGKLIDYIAMDIKGPEKKYGLITGVKPNFPKIKESIKLIIESSLPYEFRTTLAPGLHTKEDIKKMGNLIKGADKWFLQNLKSDTNLINNELEGIKAFSRKEMEEFRKAGASFVKKCLVR